MSSAKLINQTSGKVEYYTPPVILEAARRCLGQIDLDPASSVRANESVRAKQIFTKDDDGLSKGWFGRVWMNHPFGRNLNGAWIRKLEIEYSFGHVEEACCITYACTSEAWFRPLLRRPQVYLVPRTNYLLPDGTIYKGVTKGSVVTYFGHERFKFFREFRALGEGKEWVAP